MKAIFNNKIMDWESIPLSPTNRGFKYGDGFFETIALINGEPRFLESHLKRLQKAAKVLSIHVPESLEFERIYKQIKNLQTTTGINKYGKIRIYLWRNTEGLYCPSGDKGDYIVAIDPHVFTTTASATRVEISEKTVNYPSETSRFKTMNAMKYVVAAIEKKERGLDEMVLLDYQGHISETLSSNIFWKTDLVYFTPPLSTGCIEGIMRNWLMNELKRQGFDVQEKLISKEDLLLADSIFTTNALGIRPIQAFGRSTFGIDHISMEIIHLIS